MANLIYVKPGTIITWRDTGGTNALTLTSLVAGAGRQGALHDFGATTARARWFFWRFWMKFATTPVVNEGIRIFEKTGDGTHRDNDDGTGDIAVSSIDKLKNLRRLGTLIVDEASATPEFSVSGLVRIDAREWCPVIWNATADDFSATAADHGFDLTPVPDEIQ